MRVQEFSVAELEKQLKEIEPIEEKIEFISDEILRCKKAIHDVNREVKNIEPTEIKISARTTNPENSLIELVNANKKIKHDVTKKIIRICAKNICDEYNAFLERAEFHNEHYITKLKFRNILTDYSKLENIITHGNNAIERIIWRKGKDKLLELFESLYKNEILPEYSKEEILIHFADEKENPYCKRISLYKKFNWYDSDNRFSVFVNELAERGAINDESRYQVFADHFLNKKGKSFVDLPQKRNYTENFTQSGNLIRQILDSLEL